MDGQNQSTVQRDNVETVTAVGNSWIVCRSKSHGGRIYYFNTLTGEAAWNLSDQEIEKAKATTSIVGSKFESCPEPKEPPIDSVKTSISPPNTKIQYVPSRVYNKQVINNQFPKEAIAPMQAYYAPDSVTVRNNGNPNAWGLPPDYHILQVIAPKPPALHPLPEIDNDIDNSLEQPVIVQNTSLPLTQRYNQLPHTNTINRNFGIGNGANKFIPQNNRNECFGQRNGNPYNKFNRFSDQSDLRQRLTAKRLNNAWNNVNDNYQDEEVSNSQSPRIQIMKPKFANVACSDADDIWLKEHSTVRGTQLVLNVDPLKKLVTGNVNSSLYVVADPGVLFNHINLIISVVNSDEKCQLMIPVSVMGTLQNRSRAFDTHIFSRAHQCLQILSQQISAGKAVLGRDLTSDSNAYDFCCKLKAEHNVVLISNNIRWRRNNDNTITILSAQELKDTLSNVHPPKRILGDHNIEITIPNLQANAAKYSKAMSVGTQFDMYEKECIGTLTSNTFTATSNLLSKPTSKNAVDIGIQTDQLPELQSSPKLSSMGVNTETCNSSNVSEESKDRQNRDVVDSNEIPKRREIRLKRNISHQPATGNNGEKKQFKWRRKRIASAPHDNTTDEKSTTFSDHSSNTEGQTHTKQAGPEPRFENIFPHETRNSYFEPIDGSETSSSCFIQKSVDEKIVIEETSTSGVISNTASNVDSESMHNEEIYNKLNNEQNDLYKCVMFEVESPTMEEYLKMRSDEWVSRFVQIMEEVLSQILQQRPTFFNRMLPPPWTIHEATECIKKKFENDPDVNDAANMLTKVLFRISDGRGNISVNLKPSEFMELYSYGVYLVDALQSVSNIEDLQTAADSLAKLLSDITDPNLDTSHTEAFLDTSHHRSANNTDVSIDKPHNDNTSETPKPDENKLPVFKSPKSSDNNAEIKKYNLRSNRKRAMEDEERTEQPVKFIRKIDIESTFFTSLKLQKNQDSPNVAINFLTRSAACHNTLSNTVHEKPINSLNNDETNEAKTEIDKPINEPKIIRNFSKCLAEYEEKLKNKQKESLPMDAMDAHFSNSDDGYEDYYDYDYGYRDFDNVEDFEDTEYYGEGDESQLCDEKNVDKNGNSYFECFIHKFFNEIQETFLDVHSFCAKFKEELSVSKTLSSPRKFEVQDKAEKARLHIQILLCSLKTILSREKIVGGKKILNIFKEVGFHLDANKSIEYRDIIAQYSSQANTLLEAVNVVIEAVK
ncbi:uncharacterized protein LOC114361268 [Ostrinia furnacalis]|uniref:uncharacterized protein LOC114361268 n=1 Tax=Ostrinia furnacalis TaxID=93504 RepID=UPI00103FE0F9|nr:uncharacterized protein LOC114361268 [Ostrinia furnacalis]XP_028172164.1 uncharacterized protein LOC114361268 [Ostrinia furnacalis]XP_028172235.1 uncharacterized protein LOC114361268 [Ostrinia furnacalis]